VFATFYECEVQTLLNMVNMYRSESSTVEVIENPFYKVGEEVPANPPMRYIMLVEGARV